MRRTMLLPAGCVLILSAGGCGEGLEEFGVVSAAVTAAGACESRSDRAALERVDYGSAADRSFLDVTASCSEECRGNSTGACLNDCIELRTAGAASRACTGCYADAVACSSDNCAQPCGANFDFLACQICRLGANPAQANCVATLESCSGLTFDEKADYRLRTLIAEDRASRRVRRHRRHRRRPLPAPVRRYRARASGPRYRGRPVGVAMDVQGRLRLPGRDDWFDIEGRQYVSGIRSAFAWNVEARVPGTPVWFDTYDHYEGCSGNIDSAVFSAYPILSQHGVPPLDLTQLARWSGLLALVPSALVDHPNVEWQPVDDNSALATIRDCGMEVQQLFVFDEQGQIVRSESSDRYELFPGRGWVRTGSIMHRMDYEVVDGRSVPARSRIIRVVDGAEVNFLEETFTNIHFVYARGRGRRPCDGHGRVDE